MRLSKVCPECKSSDVTCQIKSQMLGFMAIEHWMCRDCGLMMQYKKKRKKDGKY
jgi:transposase-like protein